MNSKTFFSLLLLSSVVIGIGTGYFIFLGVYKDQLQRIREYNPLTSKVLSNWSAVASGKVIEIVGRTLTLSLNGEIFATTISEGAGIYLATLEDWQKKIEDVQFQDILIGDNINVLLRA